MTINSGPVDVTMAASKDRDDILRLEQDLRATKALLQSTAAELAQTKRALAEAARARNLAEEDANGGGGSRSELLLAELQHRVRNTLAVVRSIVQRTAETSESKEEYVSRLDGRLAAFTRVQAGFTRDPERGLELSRIVLDELTAHGAKLNEQVTSISGPALVLGSKPAELVGLAVHELTANAVKYGALSASAGKLSVTWSIAETDGRAVVRIDWVESGVQIARQPVRRGFGTELLTDRIAYELDGQTILRFAEDGLRCMIELPLSRLK